MDFGHCSSSSLREQKLINKSKMVLVFFMCFEVKRNGFQFFLNALRQIKHPGVFGLNLNLVSLPLQESKGESG